MSVSVSVHRSRTCAVTHHVAFDGASGISARCRPESAPAHWSGGHAFDRPLDDAALALDRVRDVPLGDGPVLDVPDRLSLCRLDRLHRLGVRRLRFGDMHRAARKECGTGRRCRQFRQGHLDRHGLFSRLPVGESHRRVRPELAPVVSGNGSHTLPTIELTKKIRGSGTFHGKFRGGRRGLSPSGTGWLTAFNPFTVATGKTGSISR